MAVLQDVRYAIRTLWKTPAFTLTALAALTLGIGANTAIFSVVDAVLLKPLTYPEADRIVQLQVASPQGVIGSGSATRFNIWRRQARVFESVAAYEYNGATFDQVHGIRVSADYFRLFEEPLALGRAFSPDEDRPDGGHVAILSYGLWQQKFAGDPTVIGRTILLSDTQYQIVGVAGRGFNTELESPPDLWLPFQLDPASVDQGQYFSVVARLKPGVTLAMANAQLQIAANEFRAEFPNFMGARDVFTAQPLEDAIVSEVRPSLLILTGAVSFVLLIACVNVANLLLVRATGRKREIALRVALGAGRGRIVKQLLTESVVLSLCGGVLGLALGMAGVRALLAVTPGGLPRIGENGSALTLDGSVVAFTLAVSLITGLLFGLIPALGVSRADLNAVLKEGGRSGMGRRQNRTRSLLVVTEMALALVLLIGAALLIRTFVALRAVDPGFDAHNVLTMRMSFAGAQIDRTARLDQAIQEAIERTKNLPGVTGATASFVLPLEGAMGIPYNIVGRTPASGRYDGRGWIPATPDYFSVFRIPVLGGRAFDVRDAHGAAGVAIINQSMARKFWPNANPVGQRILLGKNYGPEFEEPARQIVGVVGDVHDFGLNQKPAPMVYVPVSQMTDGITALATRAASMVWAVRTRVPPFTLRAAIERQIRQAAGDMPVAQVRSMDEVVVQSTARANFDMLLLTIFGVSALLLAAIGIYGLMAYSVEQRRQEIGIRLALGADGNRVRNMVVMQGMRLAFTGAAAGMVAALGLTRLIASFLFGVQAWDPLVFAAVPVILSAAALFAVWLPARRAARTDPMEALRQA